MQLLKCKRDFITYSTIKYYIQDTITLHHTIQHSYITPSHYTYNFTYTTYKFRVVINYISTNMLYKTRDHTKPRSYLFCHQLYIESVFYKAKN